MVRAVTMRRLDSCQSPQSKDLEVIVNSIQEVHQVLQPVEELRLKRHRLATKCLTKDLKTPKQKPKVKELQFWISSAREQNRKINK